MPGAGNASLSCIAGCTITCALDGLSWPGRASSVHLHKTTSQATSIAGKIFPGLAPNVTPKCGRRLIRPTPWTDKVNALDCTEPRDPSTLMDGPRSSQDLPQLEGTSSHAPPRCFSQSSGRCRRGGKKKKSCTWLHIAPTVLMKDAAKISPRSCRDFRR